MMQRAKALYGANAARFGYGALATCISVALMSSAASAQTASADQAKAAAPAPLTLPSANAPDAGNVPPGGLRLPEATNPDADQVSAKENRDYGQRGVAVMDRARPDYDAIPIPVGSFDFFPELTADAGYDSNVFGTVNGKGDVFGQIIATAALKSNWAVNSLALNGFASERAFASQSDADEFTFLINAAGRLDVTPGNAINADLSTQRIAQSRTSVAEDFTTAKPTIYELSRAQLGSDNRFGPFHLYATGQFELYDYQNSIGLTGDPIDEQYRDYSSREILLGAGYDLDGGRELFISGDYDQRRYRLDDSAAIRDGDGYQFLAGVRDEITPLIRGQIGFGYIHEQFVDSDFPDRNGLAIDTSVNYLVTELTTITFTGRRFLENVALSTSPAAMSTLIDLGVDHELYRNVILSGGLEYEHADYIGSPGKADIYGLRVGASWLVDRHYRLNADIDARHRTVNQSGIGSDVTDVSAMIGVTFRP